jgi:uncharacterized MAPEG superfamily protein
LSEADHAAPSRTCQQNADAGRIVVFKVERAMTIPVWVLLLFAAWTLLLLFLTIGYFRWSRILTGRATMREWRPDEVQGTDWYRRAMRAHANCLENLPIYTAVVIALLVTGASSRWLDMLAIVLLIARIAQSTLHIGLEQTEMITGARFGCYAIQIVCMIILGAWAAVVAI